LTTNTFTRAGYSFAGWASTAGGGAPTYADGATYPFTADATLYAQWTPLPYGGPLTFSSGDFGAATVGVGKALTVTVTNTGTAAATPSAITPAGTQYPQLRVTWV